MNRNKLKKEGEKWLANNIITKEQLDSILHLYPKKESNGIITLFAVLLISLAMITFVLSDWAQVPHLSRTLVMILFVFFLYMIGHFLNRKAYELLGVSFIVLSYLAFGVSALLTIDVYNIEINNMWLFIIWSIIGLILYMIYSHHFIFVAGIAVITYGQLYFIESFNWIIFIITLVGFGFIVYKYANYVFGSLYVTSITIQSLVWMQSESIEYYWFIVYMLGLYLIGEVIKKKAINLSFSYMSLFIIFLFSVIQTFIVQDDYYLEDLTFQFSFFMIWFVLIGLILWIKYKQNESIKIIDLILFIPLYYLTFAHVIGLTILLLFSIGSLIVGYRLEDSKRIIFSTIAFLISTFTVYIQYAWDIMNKSLFFFIGGVLLFGMSYLFEKKRKEMVSQTKE